MSLDMMGTIDPTMASDVSGGVTLLTYPPGGYTGPGGQWQDGGSPTETELTLVTIQQVNEREAQFLRDVGGATSVEDMRKVFLNDGTVLNPHDESGTDLIPAHRLKFSDGMAEREWKVVSADNRPWRNYTKALVTRYRGER